MSIWIPSLITLVCVVIFLLLVYPGKLRAGTTVLVSIALALITLGTWAAYGFMKLLDAWWH